MNLYVQETGLENEETILFLHGLGVSSWMWYDQVLSLQDHYHILNVDLPGNGESYQIEWRSFADTAAQLADLIRQRAHGGRTHLVGLSLGGYTTLHLLAQHPDLVKNVIVSGVTARPFSNAWLFKLLVPLLSRAISWDLMINLNARLMQIPADVLPLYKRDSKRVLPASIKRVYDEVLAYSPPDILATLPHRLLVVAGDSEAKMILNSLGDLPALMPNATARIAPNAHHGWNGEHPALFSQMIDAWLTDEALPQKLIPLAATDNAERMQRTTPTS